MSLADTPAFAQFKDVFKGDLVLPTDTEYKASIRRWSVLAERPAGLVAFVKDEQDVAAAVNFAVKQKLEIAIKGGGHNPSGASSTDGGVVIDLSKYCNKVTVDQDARIAHVQGGALWEDVDNATCALGLVTVGGIVSHTGVGGLTVGGGFGFLTGRHGLTIDNLIGATVVLANGEIVQATDKENPDLFFGIRGGGSNFGIVTTFQLALHHMPEICWSGSLIFTLDKLEAVVRAARECKENIMTVDEKTLVGLTQSPTDGSQVIMVMAWHRGTAVTGKKRFKAFYHIGPVSDTTSEKPYLETNRDINKTLPHGKAYFQSGATISLPTFSALQQVLSIQREFKEEVPQARHLVGIELYPMNKVMEVRNDAMAFACRGAHSNVIINVSWAAEDVGEVDVGVVRRKVGEIVRALQSAKGEGVTKERYGNYEGDQPTGDDKVKRLFGGNYRKLQTIKAKYDPDLVFGKWFPIQPLA